MSVDSRDMSVASIAAMDDSRDQGDGIAPAPRWSVADRFERMMGSKLVAMFAPALFDEMMHPAVSASLVDTARIRDDPLNRARRTAASDQLAFFAHKAHRQRRDGAACAAASRPQGRSARRPALQRT